MANIEFKVNGMMCEGCEKRVQNVIKEIDGVIDVKADHKVGIVEINTEKEVLLILKILAVKIVAILTNILSINALFVEVRM